MQVRGDVEALSRICLSYATARLDRIRTGTIRFAHYTSAKSGMQILGGREIWLRNAGVMNDFKEISYGIECLKSADERIGLRTRLQTIAEATHPSIHPTISGLFETIYTPNNTDMFMFSLCEHGDPGDLGKLSMWRAYGGDAAGVCIVVDSDILLAFERDSELSLSPVLYGTREEFQHQMTVVIEGLEANLDLVRRVPPDAVEHLLTKALRSAVLSTKHTGFQEELEWRLIHLPAREPQTGISSEIECINAIPQVVYKMKAASERDTRQVFDRLLHKVIVGPTTYPHTVRGAFVRILKEQGVRNADAKVVLSDIPLRQKS